jgi:hypothetical protein
MFAFSCMLALFLYYADLRFHCRPHSSWSVMPAASWQPITSSR